MNQQYTEWKEAHNAAVDLANRLGQRAAIRKVKEFGHVGFNVALFCENDSHNAELVKPGDPK